MQAAASASPPQFSSPAGQCRVNLDRPGSSGRTGFWPSCSACLVGARNSIAATPSRSDFIYTEMVARRRFEFYLHLQKVVGDDASKNGDFERVKQRLQGAKNFRCVILFYVQEKISLNLLGWKH